MCNLIVVSFHLEKHYSESQMSILQVYVRPAGSYVMDQLELRQVAFYPGTGVSESADCVILVGKFAIPAGLHAAEAVLSKKQVC